jgi:carbamoyl-phosphate synthase large subunit
MNILITSAGQRVSLVRAFQKELSQTFPGYKVFTTDMQPQLSAACNVSDGYFQVRRVTDPAYIDELLALCISKDVKMIVPTIDTELLVLAQHKKKFSEKGIEVIISSFDFIDKCRDKRKINAFFQGRGIGIPNAVDKNNPTFPLFIKPYDGSLSVDTFLIQKAEELQEHHLTNERFLFMEYMSRNDYDEYTVDMYFDKTHHIRCVVPRKRIHVRAGEINKGITCRNVLVDFLKEKLAVIDGAVGCLTGQFFLHKTTNRIAAIEINARFGGGYPLSYHAGANYPLWLIREYYKKETIPYTTNWEDQLLMLRYDDEVIVHANKS